MADVIIIQYWCSSRMTFYPYLTHWKRKPSSIQHIRIVLLPLEMLSDFIWVTQLLNSSPKLQPKTHGCQKLVPCQVYDTKILGVYMQDSVPRITLASCGNYTIVWWRAYSKCQELCASFVVFYCGLVSVNQFSLIWKFLHTLTVILMSVKHPQYQGSFWVWVQSMRDIVSHWLIP